MRIPSGVASPVSTNRAARGSVFVNLRNIGNLKLVLSRRPAGVRGVRLAGVPCQPHLQPGRVDGTVRRGVPQEPRHLSHPVNPLRMRPEASWARISPPRDDVGATARPGLAGLRPHTARASVCVCVRERERERQSDIERGTPMYGKLRRMAPQEPRHLLHPVNALRARQRV